MKKTLAVLMAALLVAVCFATVGSAEEAKITAKLSEDYTNVSVLNGVSLDKLFDGDNRKDHALAWGTDDANVVAFQNADCKDPEANATLCLIIDLGAKKDLAALTISFYKEYNVMIGLGAENKLTVSASDDGVNFNKVQDFDFESEALEPNADNTNVNKDKFPAPGVYDETFTFDATVSTQYLELKIPYEKSHDLATDSKVIWEFIGMTEIAFTEGDPADDDSSAESSETPATSSEASSAESSTPSTGDAGMIAVVVLAVVAVIGAAVIVRKRA